MHQFPNPTYGILLQKATVRDKSLFLGIDTLSSKGKCQKRVKDLYARNPGRSHQRTPNALDNKRNGTPTIAYETNERLN